MKDMDEKANNFFTRFALTCSVFALQEKMVFSLSRLEIHSSHFAGELFFKLQKSIKI
jgi:hypothetical protein